MPEFTMLIMMLPLDRGGLKNRAIQVVTKEYDD